MNRLYMKKPQLFWLFTTFLLGSTFFYSPISMAASEKSSLKSSKAKAKAKAESKNPETITINLIHRLTNRLRSVRIENTQSEMAIQNQRIESTILEEGRQDAHRTTRRPPMIVESSDDSDHSFEGVDDSDIFHFDEEIEQGRRVINRPSPSSPASVANHNREGGDQEHSPQTQVNDEIDPNILLVDSPLFNFYIHRIEQLLSVGREYERTLELDRQNRDLNDQDIFRHLLRTWKVELLQNLPSEQLQDSRFRIFQSLFFRDGQVNSEEDRLRNTLMAMPLRIIREIAKLVIYPRFKDRNGNLVFYQREAIFNIISMLQEFTSTSDNRISVSDFIRRMVRYLQPNRDVFAHAIHMIENLQAQGFPIHDFNMARFFLISLMINMQFFDRESEGGGTIDGEEIGFYDYFGRVGGMRKKEILRLQWLLLDLTNFSFDWENFENVVTRINTGFVSPITQVEAAPSSSSSTTAPSATENLQPHLEQNPAASSTASQAQADTSDTSEEVSASTDVAEVETAETIEASLDQNTGPLNTISIQRSQSDIGGLRIRPEASQLFSTHSY